MKPPVLLLGVPIDDVTMGETVELIGDLIADGRASGRTHQVATVNVDFLVNALEEPFARGVLQQAAVCIPDGMPLVWASKLIGTPLRGRVAGVDLVSALVARSEVTGWRIHFFGSAPGVGERALELLRSQHPAARVSAEAGPHLADARVVPDAVLEQIAAVDADILCVALGNPKQEHFIHAHRERLGIPVSIGVGGSLDMLIGDKRRAPRWAQKSGLEWLFRAAQEPRRLGKRYAKDAFVFFPHVARYARRARRYADEVSPAVDAGDPTKPRLDLGGTDALGLATLGRLVGVIRRARRAGGDAKIVNAGKGFAAQVEALRLEPFFPQAAEPGPCPPG